MPYHAARKVPDTSGTSAAFADFTFSITDEPIGVFGRSCEAAYSANIRQCGSAHRAFLETEDPAGRVYLTGPLSIAVNNGRRRSHSFIAAVLRDHDSKR